MGIFQLVSANEHQAVCSLKLHSLLRTLPSQEKSGQSIACDNHVPQSVLQWWKQRKTQTEQGTGHLQGFPSPVLYKPLQETGTEHSC